MGVTGLLSFLKANSARVLQSYTLQNSSLVIDGYNIMYALYQNSGIDFVYGGDYGSIREYFLNFFNNLKKIRVNPVVVFDGWMDSDLQHEIYVARLQRQISNTKKLIEGEAQMKKNVESLFVWKVFKNVLIEMNIKFYNCAGRNEKIVALLGNELQCPVLSNDTDFCIFDIKFGFIAFNWLPNFFVKNGEFRGSAVRTSIYYLDNFLRCFGSLDYESMIVFGSVLGNEFFPSGVFQNFIGNNDYQPTKCQNFLTSLFQISFYLIRTTHFGMVG